MLNMRLILSLVVFCLALNNGMGAPRARYMFVKCNPNDDRANCVTHQSPEMALNPDLPRKLPASATQYLEAEPVEEEEPMTMFQPGEGSGGFEGSAAEGWMADQALGTAEPEASSGEPWAEKEMGPYKGLREDGKDTDYAEQELREDSLLQL